MRNKLFSTLIIILLAAGAVLLFGDQRDINSLERRPAAKTEDIEISSLVSGTFVDQCDSVLSDQMFARDSILNGYYKAKVWFYSLFGGMTEIDDVIIMDDDYCIKNMYKGDFSQFKDTPGNKGYNYNFTVSKYPDIKAYIYHPVRIEETTILDTETSYSLISNYKYDFLYQLNDSITYRELEINNIDDYKSLYYKTDFHWNIDGAYQGYCDIIDMISQDFQLEKPKEIKSRITIDRDFFGHFGNLIGRASSPDKIEDFDLGIQQDSYDYFVNGERKTVQQHKDYYIKNGDNEYSSGYDLYYGDNDFERIFDFHQDDKPNLLIFADSFVNPMKEWLASHFNKTIIIDLRVKPEDFDVDYYINEYSVDAILLLQYYDSIYFNGYFFIPE